MRYHFFTLICFLILTLLFASSLFSQTNHSGTINLEISGFGDAQNVKTTISNIENTTTVFVDTLQNGSLQFSFQTTGINDINPFDESILLTNIPGYADCNIVANTASKPLKLDVLNSLGQKVLCLHSETLTPSQGFTQSRFYVNLCGYANGVYFLILHTADKNAYSAKILKSGEKLQGAAHIRSTTLSRATNNRSNLIHASTQSRATNNKSSLANENYTIAYEQIVSDTDLARIVNTSVDVFIDPTIENTFNHTAQMQAYPEFTCELSGAVSIGDAQVSGTGLTVSAKNKNNASETYSFVVDSQGNYNLMIDRENSANKPYVSAADKDLLLSVQGDNIAPIIDQEILIDENVEVENLNVDARYTLRGTANNPVTIKGQDESIIEIVNPASGNWEAIIDTSKIELNDVEISSQAEGYYSEDSVINNMDYGVHENINMMLDEKFLYDWSGNTNAEQIQITGDDIDTLINVVGNDYASRVYDSRDANKEVNILGSAFGRQDSIVQTTGAGSYELNLNLKPNEFGLVGTINEENVNMEFIVGEDTVRGEFSNNYIFSRQEVTDSIDVKVIAEKEWFDKYEQTLRIGPENKTNNITLTQNRWGFNFEGQGNVPVHFEDSEGKNLGVANPQGGVWTFNTDTTVNSFDVYIYTDEANRYNVDTAFTAVEGLNNEINMNADEKFFYQWGGETTPGATIEITGPLVDTTFTASTSSFASNTYDSRDANLVHDIIASKTGYEQRDTTTNQSGNHASLEMILNENGFQLSGVNSPSDVPMIVIANPSTTEDTVYNSTASTSFLTSEIERAAENINYRIITNKAGHENIDTTITRGAGLQTFNYTLNEDNLKEVIVKTIIRMSDNNNIVDGARVIYEHMTPNGIQRDTAYTQGTAPQIFAHDTIYTTADLSSIKFTRFVDDTLANYNFIKDTTENISLTVGDNGYMTEYVDPYDQVEDVEIEMLLEDGSPAVGANARAEYAGGGVYATGVSGADGKYVFEDVPAGTALKLFTGYTKAQDSTKLAYANVEYTIDSEITEENKKQTIRFYLDDKLMHKPGTNTGTSEDSLYVTGQEIKTLGQGAANVRNTMGLNDQFYLVPGSFSAQALDSIAKWSDEIERDYYNNEREIIYATTPFELGSNQDFIEFDYITNKDKPEVLGWNVSDGANNTSPVEVTASNGDGVIKGGYITIAGNKSGFIKEIVKRTNGITNAANGDDTISEKVATYYIVNARERRYNIITTSEVKVPTVNHIVEHYE